MKMKNYILSLFSVATMIAVLSSCNEDIDLTGDFKETPVVYGLIDEADSVHMLKITRAYIGPGNSLEYAQIPDSSYFPNVTATITEKFGAVTGRTWTLFDTTVLNKETDGIFYAPEQKLYAFYTHSNDNSDNPTGQPLLPNATYELVVNINNGEVIVTGQTQIVSGVSSSAGIATKHFQFADGAGITGEYKSTGMSVSPGNARIVDARLIARYEEFNGGTSIGYDSFEWQLGDREVDLGATQTFTLNGESFFQLMKSNCEASTQTVDKRNFTSMTIKVVGGSDDLHNYILVNQPSSALAQSKPTFTNLSVTDGHEVIGIFSSRQTYTYTVNFIDVSQFVRCLDRNTTHELCQGPITGLLAFCSQHSLDWQESYACQ